MALSDAEAAQLAQLLAARQAINTGQQPSEIEYAGQRMAFSKPDPDRLDRDIEQLQAKAASPRGRTRGALRFTRI